MSKIRDVFSDIMGLRIQNDNWIGYIQILEREAHFNNVHRNQLLVALGQAVEDLQKKYDVLLDDTQQLRDENALFQKKIKEIEDIPSGEIVQAGIEDKPKQTTVSTSGYAQAATKESSHVDQPKTTGRNAKNVIQPPQK